nr:MAG TPA: hypothetical protein [Caudoviricetes sp.]
MSLRSRRQSERPTPMPRKQRPMPKVCASPTLRTPLGFS